MDRRKFLAGLGLVPPGVSLSVAALDAYVPTGRLKCQWSTWWWQPCPGVASLVNLWLYCGGEAQPAGAWVDNWTRELMRINLVKPAGKELRWQIKLIGTMREEFPDLDVLEVKRRAECYYRNATLEMLDVRQGEGRA